MPVVIRLARFGQRNTAFHRIVVADSRFPRDGRFIELLGTFDPVPDRTRSKNVRLNVDRFKFWVTKGAQPSDAVASIAAKFNLYPTLPIRTELPVKDIRPDLLPKPQIPAQPKLKEAVDPL